MAPKPTLEALVKCEKGAIKSKNLKMGEDFELFFTNSIAFC